MSQNSTPLPRKQVLLVVGTRPEAIKLAPIYRTLQTSTVLSPVLLSTGQHREMLRQTFDVFGLTPDHDLDLMTPGQTLPDLNAKALVEISRYLAAHPPAAVLVQGDTTTVLAASMAAFYNRIPVGHVEAGLRTYDLQSPFPEEMNRRLASPLCRWHFAPTEPSRENLLRENIPPANIHVTGNTVIDSLLWVREKLQQNSISIPALSARLSISDTFRQQFLETTHRPWLLVTGHRRESFGQGFEDICQALIRIATEHPDIGILYPVHLNPNVREPVQRILSQHPRICLAVPAAYEDFVWLMDRCHFILSDSGGVQEEAPSLGKPVLILRDTTERPEGVTAGTCRLVGTDPARIVSETALLLSDSAEYSRRSGLKNPYGYGNASATITRVLEEALAKNS